jgi:hypothetical protein
MRYIPELRVSSIYSILLNHQAFVTFVVVAFAVTFEPIFVGRWFINIWTNVVLMMGAALLRFTDVFIDFTRFDTAQEYGSSQSSLWSTSYPGSYLLALW